MLVVEHDEEETIREADHVIDLGPGAGVCGESLLLLRELPLDVVEDVRNRSTRTLSLLGKRAYASCATESTNEVP